MPAITLAAAEAQRVTLGVQFRDAEQQTYTVTIPVTQDQADMTAVAELIGALQAASGALVSGVTMTVTLSAQALETAAGSPWTPASPSVTLDDVTQGLNITHPLDGGLSLGLYVPQAAGERLDPRGTLAAWTSPVVGQEIHTRLVPVCGGSISTAAPRYGQRRVGR